MSSLRTTITEVVTALGMTGADSVEQAIADRSPVLVNVTTDTWDRIETAHHEGQHNEVIARSWENGRAFLHAPDGLRGRQPIRVEWKGDHRPVGNEPTPVDLRVDHVYLISCKDDSRILHNGSPTGLFDHLLTTESAAIDWYEEAHLETYQALWAAVRLHVDDLDLPLDVRMLTGAQRERVKQALPGGAWPAALAPIYADFCVAVSEASAERWRAQLTSAARRERMYWRLVRLSNAPYFLLGVVSGEAVRLRVGTPWDWRQHFNLLSLTISADAGAGQPVVSWDAEIREKTTLDVRHVRGHVEVRWSKGRFRRPPEAKIYLDSSHADVAGYFPLN